MSRPRILVFASGDKEGGGSGFQEMVEFSRTTPAVLDAEIVGVITNHPLGGVVKKAVALDIEHRYFNGPYTAENYQLFLAFFKPDYVMLSGWLKMVSGLCPKRTINIHPGPLPDFGGPGRYGHFVHEAVMKACKKGEIKQSAVTMHFVNSEYDRGPIIAQLPILIRPDETAYTLAQRVNEKERLLQSVVLNDVVHGRIWLDDDNKVHHPADYPFDYSGN